MNEDLTSMSSLRNWLPASHAILLAGDKPQRLRALQHTLGREGFQVKLAAGYRELESLYRQDRHGIVLLDVSCRGSVDAAVETAIRLKRYDSRQFVGYLADPILRTSGLAGDAIFTHDSRLPQVLREYFGAGEVAL
jgi:CheY-like chemotaxis protein